MKKIKKKIEVFSLPSLPLLDRLILNAAAGPFVFGVLIFTLIFVAGDLLFQAARLIIEQGVSLGVVTRLFLYRLPEVVAMTFPNICSRRYWRKSKFIFLYTPRASAGARSNTLIDIACSFC